MRIKRIVLDLHGLWCNPKHGSYLLNAKHDNVQNLADAWKCEWPCHWLSVLQHKASQHIVDRKKILCPTSFKIIG